MVDPTYYDTEKREDYIYDPESLEKSLPEPPQFDFNKLRFKTGEKVFDLSATDQ